MVNTRRGIVLLARGERTLSTERHGQNSLVLGGVDSGRTQALRLAEGDELSVKRALNAHVNHVKRETEARYRVPVGHRAHGPVVVARIACSGRSPDDVLVDGTTAAAEQVAVDDRVVVADLSVGPVHRGREVGQPEV